MLNWDKFLRLCAPRKKIISREWIIGFKAMRAIKAVQIVVFFGDVT
jgi:hypothetical protein